MDSNGIIHDENVEDLMDTQLPNVNKSFADNTFGNKSAKAVGDPAAGL